MKKTKILLTESEWRFVIHSLNALKTELHNKGKYTDTVDDALIKLMTAPSKRVKVEQSSEIFAG